MTTQLQRPALHRLRGEAPLLTAELEDGREVELLVDVDESGRGARFVTFDACDQRDAAWVRASEGALLEAFDAQREREVWL